ncbi:carbohydrate-binding family 9-like protein [Sphingobacterium kyonggiense]|uniref:Carbohydrate-binding family 9-like protein n=1 Tax=Sphingobacterium kyonggiense TaxID=714075 RepID=A0ABP7YXZ3_9SPHI
MKHLEVSEINANHIQLDYHSMASMLEDQAWHGIDEVSWKAEFPYVPKVRFQIAYSSSHIFVHYDVEEEFVKAANIRPNESVWEDSCVEFFISFDQKKNYYNAEFNVLGTGLIGYGPAIKEERSRLENSEILKVDTFTQVRTLNGVKTWQLILAIPVEIFGLELNALKGTSAYANFYKCGDSLPRPHFISWNFIDNPTPNFHLPNYFGKINFR